jgi:hypothetical protein
LSFSSKVLKAGGHFVCKFYQGAEDKELEKQLKDMFQKVHRLKPESSRSVRLVPFPPKLHRLSTKYKVIDRNPKRPFSSGLTASHEIKQFHPTSTTPDKIRNAGLLMSQHFNLVIIRGFVPLDVGQGCLGFLLDLMIIC